MDIRPGDFVSLLMDPGITKGVVLDADGGYFVRVQWITRPFMEGRVSTHREEDLYKLAYRVSPHPDEDQGRNDEVRPSALTEARLADPRSTDLPWFCHGPHESCIPARRMRQMRFSDAVRSASAISSFGPKYAEK
jgi:hypothetical protein